MGGTAGVLHVELLNGDRVHGAKVAVSRMDHHRQVDVVEGAPADHELLAATPLFGGCAEDCDTTAERLGDLGDGQPGTKTGGADDVVPAGVADTGKRVVLAQHGDRWAVVGAHPALEGGRHVVRPPFDGQTLVFEHAGEGVVGVVLFEVQFGIGVDRVRDLEQRRRQPIDLCSHDLLGLDDVHGAESTGWLPWVVSDPDVDRVWFEPDTEVAGLADRAPIEPNRHGSFEVVLDRVDSSGRDGGVGYVGAELESRAGLPAIPEAHRGGLERVEAAVAGMGPWRDIPVVDERSVGNDEHLSPQP